MYDITLLENKGYSFAFAIYTEPEKKIFEYLKNWISRKSGEHFRVDCCFDLIRSHRPCIPWSLPLEIEPATTEPKLNFWAANSHRSQVMPN